MASKRNLTGRPRLTGRVPAVKPVLAFVDADIISGKDELAREQLLNHLRRYRTPGVSPLWVHWQRQRADLRFVCTVHDFAEFNDFMLDVVRNVAGVRETTTVLSFGGHIDIDALLELEMEVSPSSSTIVGSVMIDVEPGLDRQCFEALLDLPPILMSAVSGCSIAITAAMPT